MDIQPHSTAILDFYYGAITANEFMEYYNSHGDLRQAFDKALRSSPPDGYTVSEWLNKILLSRGDPLNGSDKTSSEYLIWLFVQDFLSKGKMLKYLSKDEISSLILGAVTDNCTAQVENYIRNKIIAVLPEFDTVAKATKYVKAKMREAFTYDNKPPVWLQCCDWAFDGEDEPMIFEKQISDGDKELYYFYSPKTKTKTVIEQFN